LKIFQNFCAEHLRPFVVRPFLAPVLRSRGEFSNETHEFSKITDLDPSPSHQADCGWSWWEPAPSPATASFSNEKSARWWRCWYPRDRPGCVATSAKTCC